MEVQGEDQIVAVQAQNLTPVQMGNVRLSDILAGLVQAAGEPVQKQDGQGCRNSPALSLRAEMGPSAAQRSALDESVRFLDVRLQDCQAELLGSTVTNIGPFLEDEFSADGQPIRLHLSNITVVLKDDGARIYPTAPQPVPAKFIIDQLLLQRSDDGIMRIKAVENSVEGANTKPSADVPAAGFDSFNGSESVQHQSERQALETQLCTTQAALTQALTERERLLLEVRKYDPTFAL